MEVPPEKAIQGEGHKEGVGGGLSSIGDDLLRNILSRLPALSFASAAVVSHSWNHLCNTILSRPKLLSALSVNPCLEVAVKDVFDKVLSEPIRPHFAFACIGRNFKLKDAHKLIQAKLGSRIPLITNVARGIIGVDAFTNKFREVKWIDHESNLSEEHNLAANINRGVVLVVGFLPGLRVKLMPLFRSTVEHTQVSMIDKFVMDIKDYAASVSGTTSPTGIIMFGDQHMEMKQVLEKLDCAMPAKTVIVGDENGDFLYNVGDDSIIIGGTSACHCGAVALIFAKDRDKSYGLGEINFHIELSAGVLPVGPTYRAASVRVNGKDSDCSTWLTARKEGYFGNLDGQQILSDIEDMMEDDITSNDLYIRVTKRRKCYVGSEKGRLISFSEFHKVLGRNFRRGNFGRRNFRRGNFGRDNEYLHVNGSGIKSGDLFRLCRPDSETAFASCNNAFKQLAILKQGQDSKGSRHVRTILRKCGSKEVFGGLIFTCYGRGESFFGRQNIDSSPFLENFPRASLAGMFCTGEIGRVSSSLIGKDIGQEQSSTNCSLHVYSTVYLVMSYGEGPVN